MRRQPRAAAPPIQEGRLRILRHTCIDTVPYYQHPDTNKAFRTRRTSKPCSLSSLAISVSVRLSCLSRRTASLIASSFFALIFLILPSLWMGFCRLQNWSPTYSSSPRMKRKTQGQANCAVVEAQGFRATFDATAKSIFMIFSSCFLWLRGEKFLRPPYCFLVFHRQRPHNFRWQRDEFKRQSSERVWVLHGRGTSTCGSFGTSTSASETRIAEPILVRVTRPANANRST